MEIVSCVGNRVYLELMVNSHSYHLVKIYREKCGMNKVQLARLAGVTQRIIGIMEEDPNYNPSRKTMLKISDALGIAPSVLFFPQEEIAKRQLLSSVIVTCLESSGLSEKEIHRIIHDFSVNKFLDVPSPLKPHRAQQSAS